MNRTYFLFKMNLLSVISTALMLTSVLIVLLSLVVIFANIFLGLVLFCLFFPMAWLANEIDEYASDRIAEAKINKLI